MELHSNPIDPLPDNSTHIPAATLSNWALGSFIRRRFAFHLFELEREQEFAPMRLALMRPAWVAHSESQ